MALKLKRIILLIAVCLQALSLTQRLRASSVPGVAPRHSPSSSTAELRRRSGPRSTPTAPRGTRRYRTYLLIDTWRNRRAQRSSDDGKQAALGRGVHRHPRRHDHDASISSAFKSSRTATGRFVDPRATLLRRSGTQSFEFIRRDAEQNRSRLLLAHARITPASHS